MIVRSGVKKPAVSKVLENPGRIKAIARAGVGVDNIDLAAATAKGVLVMNTAEASTLSHGRARAGADDVAWPARSPPPTPT